MGNENGHRDALSVKGYVVQESVLFHNQRGFVIAENPRAVQPFVTWQFTEEDGKPEMYWGHYFADRRNAVADYLTRVGEYQQDNPYIHTCAVNHLAGRRLLVQLKDIDLIDALDQIMRQNTVRYRTDFEYDKEAMRNAAMSDEPEGKHFLWFSRPSGTQMVPERMAFLRDTPAHSTWEYYSGTSDPILSYAVEVTGLQDGKVMGNLYEQDHCSVFPTILRQAVDVDRVHLTYENSSNKSVRMDAYRKMGPWSLEGVTNVRYEAKDEAVLTAILAAQREKRRSLPVGKIEQHIVDLRADRIRQEAERLCLAFRVQAAGTPASSETLQAILSQNFCTLADKDDLKRLQTALPFKTLAISEPDRYSNRVATVSRAELADHQNSHDDVPLQKESLAGKLQYAREACSVAPFEAPRVPIEPQR